MLFWTRKQAVEKERGLHRWRIQDLMTFSPGAGEEEELEAKDDCDILKTNDGNMVMLIKAKVAVWRKGLVAENASCPSKCTLYTPLEHKNRTHVPGPLLLGLARGQCSGLWCSAEMLLWDRAFKAKVYFLFTAFSWPRWPRAEWPRSHVLKMESTTLGRQPSAKRSSYPGQLAVQTLTLWIIWGHLVKAV